jgi:hypothetical protein
MEIVDAVKRARALYDVDGLVARILSGDVDALGLGVAYQAEQDALLAALEEAAGTTDERKQRGSVELDQMLVAMWFGTHYVFDATDAAKGEWDLGSVEENFGAEVAARFAPVIHLRDIKRYEKWLDAVEEAEAERHLTEFEQNHKALLKSEIEDTRLAYIKAMHAVGDEIQLGGAQ